MCGSLLGTYHATFVAESLSHNGIQPKCCVLIVSGCASRFSFRSPVAALGCESFCNLLRHVQWGIKITLICFHDSAMIVGSVRTNDNNQWLTGWKPEASSFISLKNKQVLYRLQVQAALHLITPFFVNPPWYHIRQLVVGDSIPPPAELWGVGPLETYSYCTVAIYRAR